MSDSPKTDALAFALKMLYEETADYITINKLGPVHHNRSMQLARDALALVSGKAPDAATDQITLRSALEAARSYVVRHCGQEQRAILERIDEALKP